jgi:1,4-alpha-glucan branching enzyme
MTQKPHLKTSIFALILAVAAGFCAPAHAKPVSFAYEGVHQHVSLVGDFNNWDPQATPMEQRGRGSWRVTLDLPPGQYGYKFVADGMWVLDKRNLRTTPADPSKYKRPLFRYFNPHAKTVFITGDFNNWSPDGGGESRWWAMERDPNGLWIWDKYFERPAGDYGYKFIVDKTRWINDPSNPETFRAERTGPSNSKLTFLPGGKIRIPNKFEDDTINSLIIVEPAAPPPPAPAAPVAPPAPTATSAGTVPVNFTLVHGHARSVAVAGEFNNWSPTANPMIKADQQWRATILLKPGKYMYKFVIDGHEWITDPMNPNLVDDSLGGRNSMIFVKADQVAPAAAPVPAAAPPAPTAGPQVTAAGVVFRYADPTARSVSVAGEFNNWNINANPMQRDATGVWTAVIPIPPGTHGYKFVVNGSEWKMDPANPQTKIVGDVENSALVVGAVAPAVAAPAVATPTVAPAGEGVVFRYTDPNARSVSVAGEFNRWNTMANPMSKDAWGNWTVAIPLPPGRYQYKFVVNGSDWKTDPTNPETVDDGQGNINSVMIVP